MKSSYKTYYVRVIGFFLFFFQVGIAQNQKEADSLKGIYLSDTISGEAKLLLLKDLAFHTIDDLEESIMYANELIKEAEKDSNYLYLYRGYSQKGQSFRMAGDFEEALKAFFSACKFADKLKDKKFIGGGYLTIADVYSEIDNDGNAEKYYDKSITILRNTNDSVTLGSALLNAGYDKYLNGSLDGALKDYKESSLIFQKLNYPIGKAYNIGNIGMVYAKQGKDRLAITRINEAIEILEEYEDFYAISDYLNSMSDIYVNQQQISKALNYDHRSLDLAKKYGLKKQLSETNLSLSDLYYQLGNTEASLFYYKDHIAYRDSIKNVENVEAIADMRTNFEVSQEQAKVSILEQKRKNQRIVFWSTAGILGLIALFAFSLFKQIKFVKKANKVIAIEKERSDTLLLNILPEDTAKELKDKGRVEAKKYPQVTVLFSDFKGFTQYAENLSPEVLVQTIDHYFSKFDLIMEKYDLEKIKTIGDAYMAAGGLNFDNEKHAEHMVLAAKEMNDFVATAKLDDITDATFDIRIGINTGPVVAGVVGTKKFAYDIWGDTVNIAARMESSSEAGRINISEDTYRLVKDAFDCEYRGKLAVKNRGELNMYFVNS
ncbi:adenylate/guanylate cyclase domain-containing protein [Winogradskyella sp. MIT101101]|uniref:adenylate/guanylate cyclase domain-containing protein n=1 Tax=Winogradskyella sp. MIT101101 TaxID=3098297 RepID=UPI00399ABAB9